MSMKSTALVIGAGIGGIATAARLAKKGCHVTVLEKNYQPGGRCNQNLYFTGASTHPGTGLPIVLLSAN